MKKHIILSVNDNPDYLYFLPLTVWAWRKFGWEPQVFYHRLTTGCKDDTIRLIEQLAADAIGTCDHPPVRRIRVDGYKGATLAQISRLYAACFISAGDYIMTGDIDMIPLSDYWQPNPKCMTVWGHDLTGYGHYPICYIGGPSEMWREVMRIDSDDYNQLIRRDLALLPQAKSDDFNKYWFSDQDLITERLSPYSPTRINRGQLSNGYARGRVDRGAWSMDHKEFIDCHMHHQIHHRGNEWKFQQTIAMLRNVWPDEDFTWFEEYHREFQKLTGHV